jgi:hypothetical protein
MLAFEGFFFSCWLNKSAKGARKKSFFSMPSAFMGRKLTAFDPLFFFGFSVAAAVKPIFFSYLSQG